MQDLTQSSRLIYNQQQIEQALSNMAKQINQDLQDKNPLLLCVVNGGIFLTGQLLPKIKIAMELDYIHASRYQNELSGKTTKWLATPQTAVAGRNIAILDDVLDQGLTLKEINNWCLKHQAKSIYNIVLFDKVGCRLEAGVQQADCTGLSAPNEYLFGCGLDVKGYYRNTNELYSVPDELIPEVDKYLP